MKKTFFIIFLILSVLLLVFFSQASFEGAKDGLILWLHTVVPTLFPFMVLCRSISFYLPSSVFLGLLSGYPLGAIMIADKLRNCRNDTNSRQNLTSVTKINQCMLGLFNITSPMFLTGYVCNNCLMRKDLVYLNIICVFAGTFSGTLIYSFLTHTPFCKEQLLSFHTKLKGKTTTFLPFSDIISDCASKLIIFGGYIILFSIVIRILRQNVFINPVTESIINCAIEFTNGFSLVGETYNSHKISLTTAFSMIVFFESFGCLSIFAQTQASIRGSGLSLIKYIFQKLLCGLCALMIYYIYLFLSSM